MFRKILCPNIRVIGGEQRPCNGILAVFPDWVFSVLKTLEGDSQGEIPVRCHQCRTLRWGKILYKDGKLCYAVNSDKPDLGEQKLFEVEEIYVEASIQEEAEHA
jgi:hypothetical protein